MSPVPLSGKCFQCQMVGTGRHTGIWSPSPGAPSISSFTDALRNRVCHPELNHLPIDIQGVSKVTHGFVLFIENLIETYSG